MALEKPKEGEISIKGLGYNDLIDYIEKGHIHIPDFQREFVWSRDKIIDLLDSIYKGYPVGSIILWITEEDFPHSEAIGKEKTSSLFGDARFFVIDGQQRLKSLYHAAENQPIQKGGSKKEVNVKFDLEKDKFVLEDEARDRKRNMYSIPGVLYDRFLFDFLDNIRKNSLEKYKKEYNLGENPTSKFLRSLKRLGLVKEVKNEYKLTTTGKEVAEEKDSQRVASLLVENVKFVKKALEIIKNNPGIERKEAKKPFQEVYGQSKDTAYHQFGRRARWFRSIGIVNRDNGGYFIKDIGKRILENIERTEKEIEKRYISLEKILVDQGEIDFDYLSKFSEQKKNRISELRKQFGNYKFPLIIVNKKDWNEVCDIFERINTKGQKLTIIDLMMAKTWSGEKFHLRDSLEEFKKEIGEDIPDQTILKIVAMNLEGKCKRENILSLDANEFIGGWKDSLESLRKTIGFIKNDINISTLDILPYPDLLVPISKFYYIIGNESVSKNQKKELKKWFWRASTSNRFDSAVDSKLEDDKKIVKEISKNKSPDYSYTYPQRGIEDIIERKYSLRNAFVKTILCLYSSLEPKNIVNGSQVTPDSFSKYKSRELHHVFPKNYLKEQDFEEEKIDSVVNIMFLPANVHKEGDFKDAPGTYIQNINNDSLEDDLGSHLIFNLEESGLLENNFDKFLDYRARQIRDKLREVTGQKNILAEGAISPEKPFTNEMRIRHIIRSSDSYIHWFDKYFTRRGLEFLSQEVDTEAVDNIKILTGTKQTDHNLRKEFKKFKEEMENQGVKVEMRIIPEEKSRDIHDRWLISENRGFNIPSINTIGRGQHAEINESSSRPPFEKWWKKSMDIVQEWNNIQKFVTSSEG